jgi:ABC-type transport system involved in multi-copper enzyme maturation permease subunit
MVDAEGFYQTKSNPGLRKLGFLATAAGKSAAQGVGNIFGFETVITHRHLVGIAMIMLELMIITAFAILFSSFSTPTLSAVLTVMIFLAGRLSEDILRFANRIVEVAMKDLGATSVDALPLSVLIKFNVARFFAMVTPNLDSVNITASIIHTDKLLVWRHSVLYCFAYTACLLMIATLVFRKRNFK